MKPIIKNKTSTYPLLYKYLILFIIFINCFCCNFLYIRICISYKTTTLPSFGGQSGFIIIHLNSFQYL